MPGQEAGLLASSYEDGREYKVFYDETLCQTEI